jgi:hypothetical protein
MTINTLDLERQLSVDSSRFFAEGGAGNFVVVVGFFSSGFPSFDALEPIIKNPNSPCRLSIDCYDITRLNKTKRQICN